MTKRERITLVQIAINYDALLPHLYALDNEISKPSSNKEQCKAAIGIVSQHLNRMYDGFDQLQPQIEKGLDELNKIADSTI